MQHDEIPLSTENMRSLRDQLATPAQAGANFDKLCAVICSLGVMVLDIVLKEREQK